MPACNGGRAYRQSLMVDNLFHEGWFSMKTLDINAKEWHDECGNTYFSARVTIDYGMETEKTFFVPFQYGYESQYEYEALSVIAKAGYISEATNSSGNMLASIRGMRECGWIVRSHIEKYCKKADVKAWGEE